MKLSSILLAVSLLVTSSIFAVKQVIVPMYTTSLPQKFIGNIIAEETIYGVLFIPHLFPLTPGLHGLHLHLNPSCAKAGQAAGGHYDPQQTNRHEGPYREGHLGDLPALYVDAKGHATLPTLAPRLSLEMLKNHSVMIHTGGDNYSDQPTLLGGGGARVACGVVPNFS
ncbi:MAG: hypothetical protein A3F17_01600 [Gammaproteobacteria bacterium RIFCSPHIGHO2_12_FULL_41_15]|nr:MAG: hypothetical protein A3F17_01600 [Gammaproteobacteria bacterium RIFCSPHIGHO2_12_FULL_41_15]